VLTSNCALVESPRGRKSLAALRERAIVKRIAPIWVISSVLFVACGALCQTESASEGLLRADGSNSPEAQRQEKRSWRSLPDAPSTVQPSTRAEKSQTFAYEARLALATRAAANFSKVRQGTELRHAIAVPQPSFIPSEELIFSQKECGNFVVKYPCPPLVRRSLIYHPSTSNTLMGRTSYAASHIFLTRDHSGKRKLNASYFLGVLSLVAVHNARRPYWSRSASAPFNDFGLTIGKAAGLNLLHEFEPGIRQIVKGLTPRFAFQVEKPINRLQNLRVVVCNPTR